ncbi:MAG: cytochrome d ubiquinol oxidase subunit II [Woeseiaceae bacterium]|nr:cytochrome d ubiquinol oxidase subunit II [Woeseiaceae bacterium]
METFWFIAVGFMFAMFLVLDGFDFGVGTIYFRIAKTDAERTRLLDSIGPVWHGNEVWLVAGGGLLFFAFPKVYASAFSGFYLAFMLMLWLLMLRGISIELRHQLKTPMWRPVWDVTFSVSSFLLAFVFGVAIGNLTRGVPINAEGFFYIPFWTDFRPLPDNPGILDAWTITKGLLTVVLLSVHGANWVALKTDGILYERAARLAKRGGWMLVVITIINIATFESAHELLYENFNARPLGWIIVAAAPFTLAWLLYSRHKMRDVQACAASTLFILITLGVSAWAYYPNMLISPTHHEYNLTIYNSAATPYALQTGLYWFIPALCLIAVYTVYVHRAFWGKVPVPEEGQEH